MKKTIKIFAFAAIAAMAFVSCKKENKVVDFDIVGDFNITAEKGASNGWIPKDKVGVFVTSEGLTQSNLAYTPSQVAEDKSMEIEPGVIYHMYGDPVGNVALNADAAKAGFKKGEHVIYAYSPYAANAELTAVPVPDITAQDASYQGMTANQTLCFCCTEKKVSEYSQAPVDLGKLECKYLEANTGSFNFDVEDGALDGRSIKAMEISAEIAIAQSGTYNLVEKKYNGEGSKKITMTNINLAINANPWMGGYGTEPIMFFSALDEATVIATEFTFTATLDNDKIFVGKATPQSMMGMISFMGSIVLAEAK